MITENKEKYFSFNVDVVVDTYEELGEVKEKKIQLRFIDSIRFMASNQNLVKGGHHLNGFEDYSKAQYV